jgi:hypothetical protein
MSGGRSFRSVFMVASCAGAALGCYLVSLRVASERAAVESVETQIVLAQRDIRLLQTEIGTRGRLAQLERWNVKVLALSAPSADQFLDGGFALAKMVAPQHNVDLEAPVVLAAAPVNAPKPRVEGVPQPEASEDEAGVAPKQMMYTASFTRPIKPAIDAAVAEKVVPKAPVLPKTIAEKTPASKAAKVADKKVAGQITAKAAPASPKVSAKVAVVTAKSSTKPSPVRMAQIDPLAPKPAKAASRKTAKDTGSKQ